MEIDDPTPPEHPTFGINIPDETIKILIRTYVTYTFDTLNVSELSHKLSYNNKIYIIHLTSDAGDNQSYVLKVNGRFHGAAKVENEVACLLLLEKFCSAVPVPRVIAWSANGLHISRKDRVKDPIDSLVTDGRLPGWILMTKLPGSPLEAYSLSLDERKGLASELASSLASWRQCIPPSDRSASLHFRPRDPERPRDDLYPADVLDGQKVFTYGFVDSGNHSGSSAGSLLEHWQAVLGWQISRMTTDPVYAPNRDALLRPLRTFLETDLPRLALFSQLDKPPFVFSHTDFFPRNVLVQRDPLRLSGIVDFEFAGFYPEMGEFVQDWLPEDDDSQWPADMYEMMLDELDRLDEKTPRCLEPTERTALNLLHKLEDCIAPWWLREVDVTGIDTISAELLKAREDVNKTLKLLEALAQSQK